jgi:hypothetical protein
MHEVPVFNLRIGSQPVLLAFRFTVFRLANRKKIFISARVAHENNAQIAMLYVHTGNALLLELTEKAALKYLMMSGNDFGGMIEDTIIVTNNRLKIENVDRQKYLVREVMNGGQFAYVDDTASQSPPEQEALKAGGNHSHASIAPKVYRNVQLIPRPKDQTLTSQLSAAGDVTGLASRNIVGLKKSQNMRSLRNALFNVSSEQGLSDSPEAYISPQPGEGTEQI